MIRMAYEGIRQGQDQVRLAEEGAMQALDIRINNECADNIT